MATATTISTMTSLNILKGVWRILLGELIDSYRDGGLQMSARMGASGCSNVLSTTIILNLVHRQLQETYTHFKK